MTARLKLSRVLLIFGPDGDNNIQDPETGCFVTFLHNGRVQISTNTTNDAATTRQRRTHERLLGSCLVHTKTRSQDHLPLITTCPVHPRPSLRRVEPKWNKLNPSLCDFLLFARVQVQVGHLLRRLNN